MLLSMSQITQRVGKIWAVEWLYVFRLVLKTKVLPNINRISKCIEKVNKPSLEVLGRLTEIEN